MVGDGQVLVPRRARRERHLLDRGGAVRGGGVAVQVAPEVSLGRSGPGSVPAAAASSSPRFSRSSGSMYSGRAARTPRARWRSDGSRRWRRRAPRTPTRAVPCARRRRAAPCCVPWSRSGAGAGSRTGRGRRFAGRPGSRCACAGGRRPRSGVPADSIRSSRVAAVASASGSVAVAITSRSLTVSVIRRAEPASSTCREAGWSRSAAISGSAIASARSSTTRAGRSPAPANRRLARIASSALGPKPLSERIRCSSAALRRRSSESIPSSS